MKPIPLVDLAVQHSSIKEEVDAAIHRVIESGSFILGEEVQRFEEAYAAFAGVKHCIGVANGTDAIELSLRAAGIGPGDDVLLPSNTFAATALAVVRTGARPVFVDVDADCHLIDPVDAEKRLTPASRAIIPVHLYGQMAPMEEIEKLAEANALIVVEDAAQAQGAKRFGSVAGSYGMSAGTSFYPAKNLGAYGDAGAVLTNSDQIAETIRALRNYGASKKYHHDRLGFNSRLDSLQAAVLNVKLERLSGWNESRRQAAGRYIEMLSDVQNVSLPVILDGNEHIWHLFVVRIANRDRVLDRLIEEGIGAGVHYPVPLHLQPAFSFLGLGEGQFPRAEAAAKELLSLPIFPEIEEIQQQRVVDVLTRAVAG